MKAKWKSIRSYDGNLTLVVTHVERVSNCETRKKQRGRGKCEKTDIPKEKLLRVSSVKKSLFELKRKYFLLKEVEIVEFVHTQETDTW